MSDLNIGEFDHKKNKLAGGINETASRITSNEQLEVNGKMQFSEADFKRKMSVKDETEDNRYGISGKINDRFDRNEKQINLAYWANVNNAGNSQIILHAQESLPEIYTIKNIYIVIVMGKIIIKIDDQEERVYSPGNVIDVPRRTKMKIKNFSSYKTAILAMKL